MELQDWRKEPRKNYSNEFKLRTEFPYSLLALTTDYIPPYLSLLCINHRY